MHMNHNLSDHSDSLNARVMQVYVFPRDGQKTTAKIDELLSLAQQHHVSTETREGTDQKIRVVVRGAMWAVVTAAHAIRLTESLKDVFTSELHGDYSKRPAGSQK